MRNFHYSGRTMHVLVAYDILGDISEEPVFKMPRYLTFNCKMSIFSAQLQTPRRHTHIVASFRTRCAFATGSIVLICLLLFWTHGCALPDKERQGI
ncbi:hypothetical protein CY34DRAFT_571299 [Suillus luteus UH-Slu-Lm8-n1]|uniref:Uncharacterized protein n=1 Tax=Suillus luteus UH-Slu-Lm8-n1 TaxID=930992 RepID=A0A0D0AMP6_9AGAM|nr:hypothetical protein CY34DRAFT_571299 [Suillus luteus UH-Slu-Lm8-n1]